MDNLLAYMDQGSFLGLRALGRQPLTQFVWIYDHDVDVDGLRRFHGHLGYGLLGRRIETSPLPFGRHRWVAHTDPADLDIAASELPAEQVWEWADTRAQLRIDPECGPAWHLGVQPLTPGGAAVSLVASHSVADGRGLCLAIAEAVGGTRRDLSYPAPRDRARRVAVLQDLGTAVRSLPDAARGLVAAVRTARTATASKDRRPPARKQPVSIGANHRVVPPTATVWIDLDQWDRRAENLGGKSNSLFVGLMSRLALALGRVASDGRVQLSLPVSDRIDGDTRANALTVLRLSADPAVVTDTLADLHSEMKAALTALPGTSRDLLASMGLVPFTPRVLVRRLEMVAGDLSDDVGCSNLGECDPAINRPDGTDAHRMAVRAIESTITPAVLDRMHGYLFGGAGRVNGRIFVSVGAWVPGTSNSKQQLREWLGQAVVDMGLTGMLE